MREFKFRGWNKGLNKMVEFEFLDIVTDSDGAWVNSGAGDTNVAACEIMQFTGLHDKNGREIYEGDILRSDDGGVAAVKYEAPDSAEFTALYKAKGDGCWNALAFPNHAEVIGNVWENPQLLK